MCDLPDRIRGEDVEEVVPVRWARIWPMLRSRHGECSPSEDCIVDVCALLGKENERGQGW